MAPFQVFLPGDDGSARARALCCPAACRACGPAARATPLSLPPPALYRHPQGKQSAKERQTHIERERESDECASAYMLMHMHVKAPHISLASHTRTYSLIHSFAHSLTLFPLQGFRAEAAARADRLAMYHVRPGATIISFRAIEVTPVRTHCVPMCESACLSLSLSLCLSVCVCIQYVEGSVYVRVDACAPAPRACSHVCVHTARA
jgi:hypothetical protein